MKILIPEAELKEVITDYLREQMPERANEVFDVKLIASRGPDGHCAEINVEKRGTDEAPTPTEEENTEEDAEEAAVDPFNFGGEDDS